MGNIVILEGPDACGKTMFANYLVSNCRYYYHHEGVPPAGVCLSEYYGNQLLAAKYSNVNHVFDRHFLGQLVYGPIHRNDAEIKAAPFMWLVYTWDIKLILFNTDFETQLKIWKERHHNEHIKKEEILFECYNAWVEMAEKYPFLPRFDYRKDSYHYLMNIVNERRH